MSSLDHRIVGVERAWLHAEDGSRLRRISPEGWNVAQVEAAKDGASVVWTGHRIEELGAGHRTAVRQEIADGEIDLLTPEDKWSSVKYSAASGNVVITASRANEPPVTRIKLAGDQPPIKLPVGAIDYDAAALPQWELLTVPGPDGAHFPAALLRPVGLADGEKAPAIMYHYGGPASQVVSDSWGRSSRTLWHKMMAQRGYAVLMVDNAASNYFGKRGADRIHRRFGEVNLAAQERVFAFSPAWVSSTPTVSACGDGQAAGLIPSTRYSIARESGEQPSRERRSPTGTSTTPSGPRGTSIIPTTTRTATNSLQRSPTSIACKMLCCWSTAPAMTTSIRRIR